MKNIEKKFLKDVINEKKSVPLQCPFCMESAMFLVFLSKNCFEITNIKINN